MKKHFILSAFAILLALGKTLAQTYVPVATTGYSLDGVAENTTAISTTSGALDDNFFVLYSQAYGALYGGAAVGLPNNGTLVNGSRTYQLQPYTGFNVVHLLSSNTGTLNFVTPQAFPSISLLGFGTQGSAAITATVVFTDNTTQVFPAFTFDDWFSIASPMFSGFDRVDRTLGTPAYVGSAGNPKMAGADLAILCANQGKPISKVIVRSSGTGTSHAVIMAVSGAVPLYSVTGNPLICGGGTSTLNATGFASYTWQPAGSFAGSNSATVAVSPAANTIYTLTGTDINGCPGYTTIAVNVSSGAPVISLAGSSQSICLGAAATITASGALAYTLTSPAANGVAFTPNATASYTVTGANGCGTNSLAITITVSPLAVSASALATLVCSGAASTLTAGGATNYTWMPGISSQTNYVVNPLSTTIYTVTGKTGNCSGTNTLAITTKPLPTLSITPSTAMICSGNSANLVVSGNAQSYTWSAANQTGLSISVSPATNSVYTVIGTHANGCTSSAQQVIIVNPNPTVTASSANPLVCAGGASTLTAFGANSYAWDNGANGTSIVVNPSADASYVVTGSYTTGCNATATVMVSIYVPVLSVSGDTFICQGSHVNISADGADTYTWTNNNTISQVITVSPAANTIYTVTGSVSDPNTGVSCDASNTLQVTVNPNPVITAASNHTNNVFCHGESAILTGSGLGSTGSYTWTGGAGVVHSATTTVTPIADQTYTVIGIDANGCKGTSQITVKISVCQGIAVNTADAVHLSVYPNPSNGEVTIKSEITAELLIINELGQTVRALKLNAANGYQVTVEGLSSGIYVVTSDGNGAAIRQKLVITK